MRNMVSADETYTYQRDQGRDAATTVIEGFRVTTIADTYQVSMPFSTVYNVMESMIPSMLREHVRLG